MNSNWLLLRTQRRSLLFCAAVCFIFMFLLVYADFKPSTLDKASIISSLSLGIAFMVTCIAKYHTALFTMPFPVTLRQLAWLPTLCFALLWVAGIAGALTGVGILSIMGGPGYTLSRWTPIFLVALKTLPFAFLIFAIGDRLLRYLGFGAIGFVVFLQFYFISKHLGGIESALAFYHYAWPACIVLGVFFILEAPAHIAALDYPARMKQGWANMTARQPNAPMRTPAIKIAADFCMTLMLLLVAVWFFSPQLPLLRLNALSTLVKLNIAILAVFALFCMPNEWRRTKANGFSANKALAIFLMKCSLVFLPIAWALGAKRGIIASCDNCRQSKFIWAHRCPYCGHANQGTVLSTFPFPLRQANTNQPPKQKRMSSRRLYRVVVPIYLVMIGFITGSGGNFHTQKITMIVSQEATQPPETTLAPIREYLASIDDPRAWLNENADAPIQLPERFRIEVTEYPLELRVHCYWLRWENAGPVAKRVEKRIREAFPDALHGGSTNVRTSDYERVRVNRAALPSFLDAGIHSAHWKDW